MKFVNAIFFFYSKEVSQYLQYLRKVIECGDRAPNPTVFYLFFFWLGRLGQPGEPKTVLSLLLLQILILKYKLLPNLTHMNLKLKLNPHKSYQIEFWYCKPIAHDTATSLMAIWM